MISRCIQLLLVPAVVGGVSSVAGLPTLPVDESQLQHAVEHRGFVSVPLDYGDASSPQISIFYRFIPSSQGTSAPTLIYVNGGPGYPSSIMRRLDYDYTTNPVDSLTNLLTLFNVVLVDQRGTQGLSFPLDQTSEALGQEQIGRYMHADNLALDHARVIDQLIQDQMISPAHVYVLGHSFGTAVVSSYMRMLAEGKIAFKPTGIIVSAGDAGPFDPFVTWIGARPAQKSFSEATLAYSQQRGLAPFDQLVARTRAHFQDMGYSPDMVHFAYTTMIGGTPEDLYQTVQGMLDLKTDSDVAQYLSDETDCFNFISHILAIQSLYGGNLAANLRDTANAQDPRPDWIIDPTKAIAIEESYVTERHRELLRLFEAGKIPVPKNPTGDQIKNLMNSTKILYHFARADVVTGTEAAKAEVYELLGPELAAKSVVLTDGGHRDIRSPAGVKVLKDFFGL